MSASRLFETVEYFWLNTPGGWHFLQPAVGVNLRFLRSTVSTPITDSMLTHTVLPRLLPRPSSPCHAMGMMLSNPPPLPPLPYSANTSWLPGYQNVACNNANTAVGFRPFRMLNPTRRPSAPAVFPSSTETSQVVICKTFRSFLQRVLCSDMFESSPCIPILHGTNFSRYHDCSFFSTS